MNSIKSARMDVDHAISIFNELTDAEAIDYASYNLLAARTRYSYLLKIAKKKELSL
ncbi:MAG: DUF2508 family protein [Firmicutes bacterium]|nr:DUF2508 family protein [Bacillota bacterium]